MLLKSSTVPTFVINDTKLYVQVVNLSTQDNAKLLQQLKWSFKRIVKWNKYQTKATVQTLNQCFVLSFENNVHQTSYKQYCSDCRNKKLQCYDWWK